MKTIIALGFLFQLNLSFAGELYRLPVYRCLAVCTVTHNDLHGVTNHGENKVDLNVATFENNPEVCTAVLKDQCERLYQEVGNMNPDFHSAELGPVTFQQD